MAQPDTPNRSVDPAGEPDLASPSLHGQHAHRDETLVGQRFPPDESYRGRGPKGYRRSDERIREDICERLLYDEHVDSSEVSVEVKDRHVVLEGSVTERRMKHAIEDIAAGCAGVADVENRIKVLRPAWREGPPFLY